MRMPAGEVMGSANQRRERDGKDGRELQGRRRKGGGFALSYRAGSGWTWNWAGFELEFEFDFF